MLPQLASGEVLGGTGMSNPMKYFAAIESLALEGEAVAGGFRVSGRLPWVSNLGPGHVFGTAFKTAGQGAAAGNRYDWTAYATTSNNACISLAFILHSANPGNYATPPPVFDMPAESAVIGATMATFNKINP